MSELLVILRVNRNKYNIGKFCVRRVCEKYRCKIDKNLKENQGDNKTLNEAWKQLKKIISVMHQSRFMVV